VFDGVSNAATNLAYTGFMFINTPEDVGLASFRWFDWYSRPGVYAQESTGTPTAGDGQQIVAEDKEAIQYALLSNQGNYPNQQFTDWEWRGITSGANPRETDYNAWYFHSSDNTNYDSIDLFEQQLQSGNADALAFVSTGPYDISINDNIELSFAIVFGEDENDLNANAQNIKNASVELIVGIGSTVAFLIFCALAFKSFSSSPNTIAKLNSILSFILISYGPVETKANASAFPLCNCCSNKSIES
jgi:hypothetical protein